MIHSTVQIAPRPISRGTVSTAEHPTTARLNLVDAGPTVRHALTRAAQSDYFGWLDHIRAAAGCTRPIRLTGDIYTIHRTGPDTARILGSSSTDQLPDGAIYKACGNRRATVCPACARTYQRDAYQLLRAGLTGGKGVPDTVSRHPAVFVTLTAPSFGLVHTRVVRHHTCTNRRRCDCRPEPCRARTHGDTGLCQHRNPTVCFARHDTGDERLGRPLCLDCYDHEHQVVWNLFTGELWRRTKQAAERHLAHLAKQRGIPPVHIASASGKLRAVPPVRISHGKAAEFQIRGAVHFHALLRLDGVDPTDPTAVVPPPAGFSSTDLDDAITHAVTHSTYTSPAHSDRPRGWHICWGQQLDVRHISLTGRGEVTDQMVAAYLAKYATKSTEVTGHQSTRITQDTIGQHADPDGDHTARLIYACWRLGRRPNPLEVKSGPYVGLRRWAHMLGFGGHFLTKARRYSVTFALLRATRITYRRREDQDQPDPGIIRTADHTGEETTLTVGVLTFAGVGWHNTGDALLANTAAALARERHQTAREEIAHEIGSTLTANPVVEAAA